MQINTQQNSKICIKNYLGRHEHKVRQKQIYLQYSRAKIAYSKIALRCSNFFAEIKFATCKKKVCGYQHPGVVAVSFAQANNNNILLSYWLSADYSIHQNWIFSCALFRLFGHLDHICHHLTFRKHKKH